MKRKLRYNSKPMNSSVRNRIKLIFKLKTLDWFIVFVVAGIITFLIATSLNRDRWITIEFKVSVNPDFPYAAETPPYWIVEKIKPGDVQYDNLGQENLKVLSVNNWGYQFLETWVTASVKTKYKAKQKQYTYQYLPLEIGKFIDITINGTGIHGIVTAIQGFSDIRPRYSVTVKTRLIGNDLTSSAGTRGVDIWIADAVDKGNAMKDATGKTVAEILDKAVEPAKRIVTTNDGRVFVTEDPLKKDVYLTVKLNVTKHGDTYLFLEDRPIKIGYGFPIYLNNILISPVITEIL